MSWQSINTTPKDGTVIKAQTDIGEINISWAQELFKAPPPFLERPIDYKPEQLRPGSWRLAVLDDVIGWGWPVDAKAFTPTAWTTLTEAPKP